MRLERSTQEMLAAILDARRALHHAQLRCVNCPERMREWCRQDAEWREAMMNNLQRELECREDAHVIETALRFLLAENTTDDA